VHMSVFQKSVQKVRFAILFRRLYVYACVYMHERKLSAGWQDCVVGAYLYVMCIMHVCVYVCRHIFVGIFACVLLCALFSLCLPPPTLF